MRPLYTIMDTVGSLTWAVNDLTNIIAVARHDIQGRGG
jgi:hypothetical protein